jgi:hypothetical protein
MEKPPTRIPMLLSAFVCPGAGQFMQRRWLAGAVFSSGFLSGFIWLMVLAAGIISDFYRMGFEFETFEPTPVSPTAFIAPLALCGGFYLANLIDIAFGKQKAPR